MEAKVELIQGMLDFKKGAVDRMVVDRVEVAGQVFVCVPARFSGMSFGQFIQTDMIFEYAERYLAQEHKDSEELILRVARVIACIYRSSPFERLDKKAIEHRAKLLSGDGENLAILYANYREMRNWLEKQYPFVFPKGEAADEKKPGTKTGGGSDWLAIRDKMATTLRTTFEEVNKMLLHDILRFMNRELKEK